MLFTGFNLYAQNTNAPDMALLEFLGEGVKVGDDVVDPISWQAMQDMTGSNQDKQQQARQAQVQGRPDSRRQAHE